MKNIRGRSGDSHFAPLGAPRCARAAGDVTREVLEDVRWSMDAIEPWGEGKDGLSAVAGRTASWSTRVSRVKKRSQF